MSKINYWKIMTRRKPLPQQECGESKLGRVFGTFDLTALGVSSTLGVGVYVLAGHVAKDQAGPSVIISFLIAAVASFLAGLCYAEFSSRVPKSGSAYIFAYVAIGEFLAFIVGWNLILEYIIGAASISKGLSLYIDAIVNDTMKNNFKLIAPISWNFLSSYFDFFAFGCPLLIGLALAFGLRKSAGVNNVFCVVNLGVVVYVIVAVIFNADINNWRINPVDVPAEQQNSTGTGGFFPFGFSGTLKGAATCFFGFVGFDCIATTGEEVRNPQKTIPRALLYSLAIIFLAYLGISLMTLMWPYYLLNPEAPLPHVFEEIDWIASKWIVTIGGIFGLIASLFGALFPLPRILYAMAQDGLIFQEFGIISQRFQTPVIGTLCAAFLTSLFSALFDLSALVGMLSIGVLLAYTVVAISIIVLRFSQSTDHLPANTERYIETSHLLRPGNSITTKGYVMQMIRLNASRQPNRVSLFVVATLITVYCIFSFALSFTILFSWDAIANGESWALSLVLCLAAFLLLLLLFISIQPRQKFSGAVKPFKVPIVPFLPGISVFVNIYLMLMLDYYTWIRFGIWMILGLLIYFLCAWLYNPKTVSTKKLSIEVTNIDIERANDSDVGCNDNTNDDMAVISSVNCDDVAVVGEKQRSTSISTLESAIEMLDTVINAEEISSSSIRSDIEIIQDFQKQTSELSLNRSKSLEDGYEWFRQDLQDLVEDILIEAQAAVDEIEFIKRSSTKTVEDDNVFKNRSFLAHLNELVSKSGQTSAQDQSKSLEGVHKNSLTNSKSNPDLQSLMSTPEVSRTAFKDDTQVVYELEQPIPPPPIFHAELFEKVATLKRTQKKNLTDTPSISVAQESVREEEKTNSPEIVEPISKENFRDKLEKLLSVAPTRLSLVAPTPLPRTSLNKDISKPSGEASEKPSRQVHVPAQPISATMMKHREMFDEVLKKLKQNEDSLQPRTALETDNVLS